MANFRNIAFVGHGDSGKTSFTEQILFKTGATNRLGEVESGSSVCDAEPDEKERKNSIDCAIVHASAKDCLFNIFDAPGYPDFVAEAISALCAADSAVLFINASSGIMINTRKMWDKIKHYNLPCAIVINKIDMENLKLQDVFASVRETFGENCIPVILPNATGSALKETINVMDAEPDKLSADSKQYRDKMIEASVEVDDQLLNKYLDGKEITKDELASAVRKAFLKGKVVPVFCVSAKKGIGIDEFLGFAAKYFPAPNDLGAKAGVNPAKPEELLERKFGDNEPFSSFVFKCVSDPFVGKIVYMRIFSGVLTPDLVLFNSRTQKTQKLPKLFKPFGKDLKPVDKTVSGDIVAVTKIEDMSISDTFSLPANPIKYPAIEFPSPMVSLAIEPKSKGDEQRLSVSLAKMTDSDPTFKILRDRQTNELVISGISTLHLDVVMGRLKQRYDVQVNTKQPKIPYKETINLKAEGQYKHKKQTGGRGQYGEVYLRIEPLPRGEGFKFNNEIFGGSIPNQFVPAIEKGVRGILERGVIAGYPVVDVSVTVYDGSYHVVDSSEAAFKIAGSKAFQIAFKNAKPTLIEPVVNIEITIPSKFMGDITGDLTSRRGRITGMDTIAGQQVIKATVPLAEVSKYSTELRSITGGEGHYTMEFSHYDIVPGKTQEMIIANAKIAAEEEE
ncbi:MAG: elongation factor G [Planctomycetes bacterium]|nr:elongation factor G [Planctomycetota bacterium]